MIATHGQRTGLWQPFAPAFTCFDHSESRGFNLIAQCAMCGAITEQPLVLAWEMRHVACSHCGVVMRIDESVLARLREQAVGAQATIDRLS